MSDTGQVAPLAQGTTNHLSLPGYLHTCRSHLCV